MRHVDAGDVITYRPDLAFPDTERATVTLVQPPADAPPDAGSAIIHLQLMDGSLHRIPHHEVEDVPVPIRFPEDREQRIRALAIWTVAWRMRNAPLPTLTVLAGLLPDDQLPIVRNAIADLLSLWATVDGHLLEDEIEQIYSGEPL